MKTANEPGVGRPTVSQIERLGGSGEKIMLIDNLHMSNIKQFCTRNYFAPHSWVYNILLTFLSCTEAMMCIIFLPPSNLINILIKWKITKNEEITHLLTLSGMMTMFNFKYSRALTLRSGWVGIPRVNWMDRRLKRSLFCINNDWGLWSFIMHHLFKRIVPVTFI